MSEQLLDRPQVGAAVEKVRRERVPQRVRVHRTPQSGACRPDPQAPAHVGGRERPAGLREQQRPLAVVRERGSRALEIVASARIAGSPTGTKRVLEPLPSTRTCSASKSTESSVRLTSSSARRPAA